MADQKTLSHETYFRFVPDQGTADDAFESKANHDHAGYYEYGVTVNGVDVPISRVKGGQYDIPSKAPKSKGTATSDDDGENENEA